ncbi:hypothetical protein FRC11_003975 [Ceratobasidium sp. 423]|nr:hypothetical protein FRC11_003975 [Ceratobasidium sp. 423]
MQTDKLLSSQEFIRALKAPKDPPRPGGTLKIDLARQAWELETLFIPSKGEVIVEWTLQSLLTAGVQGGESGVLDGKSWRLLADIVTCTRLKPNLNSIPTWLNAVINRVAVWPIFTQLLRALGTVPGSDSGLDVLGVVTAVAHVLLPPAALKASCDALAGCFWEVLGLFAAQHDNETLLSALELCDIIVSTFESSFGNCSNKKKIAVTLVDHHLDSWLRQSKPCYSENTSLSKFRHRLFDVGSSIIFTPEHTRSIFQHSDTHPVLLATAASPRIFTVYVSALRTHKLSVFLDQNNSGGLVKRIRGAARELFARSVAERDWGVVAQLVRSAEELQVVDDEWAQDLGALVDSAVQALDSKWTEEQARIGVHVCSTLACILRLNFDVVEPFTERLLSGLCDAPLTLSGVGTVFELLLDYHSKARTLAGFLPQLASAGSREFYQATCLGVIEFNLSAKQLGKILDLFVTMSRTADIGGAVTSAGLFDKTIGLAQFWEMPNIRRTLNDKIVHDTSSLDDADLHRALKAIRKGKTSKQAGSHDVAISMYFVAALAPPDYLDRSVKTTLLSRAPCADVLATRPKDRAAVRVVLRQLSSGSTALPEEYVRYLLDPQLQTIRESPSTPQDADDALSVLAMSFRVYSRLAKDTSTPDDLVTILRAVETLQLFDLPYWDDPSAVMSIRATLSLLNTILETWGMKSTLPDEIHAPVAKILQQIYNRVEQTHQAVTDLLIEAARLLQSCEQWFQQGPPIDAFSRSRQALTRMVDDTQNSRRARRFLRTLLSQNSAASEALLRLLTQEIQHADEDVRLLIAAFTLNAQSHNNDTQGAEHSFGEACRRINADQHGALVEEIVTLLLEPETNHIYRVATIRMASLAIRFAPEGTSKARRRTTTAVLHALAQLPQLALFQEACTKFIAEICTDRANALTAPDIAAIWILLDRATSSMEETFLRTYSSIVVALNSLVRFRRDLLTPTLAQLAALLTRLIRILRLRTSHAIGAPQRSVESQASLTGKATELARLLVGLSTKTVVRLPGSNKPEQATKAESLARPFARHAPYLLVAYAQSAVDMSTAVRNALKPGLFALCVMCGTPARDMIMVTMLDTVEKEVFGALWREWEAQKYTGKG